MKFILLFFLILFQFAELSNNDNWDKDAGLVSPFTQNASIKVSSNPDQKGQILDGKTATAWQSDAPFPQNFILRPDLNLMLNNQEATIQGSNLSDAPKCIDGDVNSVTAVGMDGAQAKISFVFPEATQMRFVSIKAGNSALVQVVFRDAQNQKIALEQLEKDKSYQLNRFEINKQIKSIELFSTASFQLFEIAATAGLPTEYVEIDMGEMVPVGIINCRHWPGDQTAEAVSLFISKDAKRWKKIKELDPNGLHNVIIDVKPEQEIRYIRVEYELVPRDWNKIYLWEVSAYDKNAHYGPIPKAEPSTVNLTNMLGVNGIWGWGTNQYSDLLPEGQGPSLYRPIAKHARNYHDMGWDVADPDNIPDYQQMALGKGTEVQWWLNWDKEYYEWLKKGMNVQATIQIHNFKPQDWDKPFESAYAYSTQFASHFGTGKGNGLICTYEAGNEPWKYDAETYKEILYGMAKGVKDTDPELEVFPCALQAADPSMEETAIFKNYMGARLTPREAAYVDGINIHCYSYVNKPEGGRKAVHPEHPHSTFREAFNAIRFRNKNLPGKKIYLSEWGWDSAGGGEDCTHEVCVSEEEGAVYGIRGALMTQRLGIDRATWYFYANSDKESSLYTRSGLTGTGRTGFKKKKVYLAFESLLHHCGTSFFLKTIQEDEEAWVYLMGNAEGQATHLIAWRPIDLKENAAKVINLKGPYEAQQAIRIDGVNRTGTVIALPDYTNGSLMLEVDAIPLIVELKNN